MHQPAAADELGSPAVLFWTSLCQHFQTVYCLENKEQKQV